MKKVCIVFLLMSFVVITSNAEIVRVTLKPEQSHVFSINFTPTPEDVTVEWEILETTPSFEVEYYSQPWKIEVHTKDKESGSDYSSGVQVFRIRGKLFINGIRVKTVVYTVTCDYSDATIPDEDDPADEKEDPKPWDPYPRDLD